MRTLKENYKANADILRENIRRGLTRDQATGAVDSMQAQFERAGLYNQDERDYIAELREIIEDHFTVKVKATTFAEAMGIEVIEL